MRPFPDGDAGLFVACQLSGDAAGGMGVRSTCSLGGLGTFCGIRKSKFQYV